MQRLGLPYAVGALDRSMGRHCAEAGHPHIDLWREEVGRGSCGGKGGWVARPCMPWHLKRCTGRRCYRSLSYHLRYGVCELLGMLAASAVDLLTAPQPRLLTNSPPAGRQQQRDQPRRGRLVLQDGVQALPQHGSHQGAGSRQAVCLGRVQATAKATTVVSCTLCTAWVEPNFPAGWLAASHSHHTSICPAGQPRTLDPASKQQH